MIYLLIIFAFVVLSFIYDYRQARKWRALWWIVMMVVLICVAGFRYQMGTDSIKYEEHYKWEHTLSHLSSSDFKDTRYAPLYIIFSSICRTITPEFMLVQFVIAILVNVTVFRFIWLHTRHIFLAGLLYSFFLYFMLNMEVLREAMAVCIFLWAWPLYVKGKWVWFYLCAAAAFLFHVSAVILFLLPLINIPGVRWFFELGQRTWFIVAGILLLSFAMHYFFFDLIQAIAVNDTMAERAEKYSKDDLGGNLLNIAGAVMWIGRGALYPIIALCFLKDKKRLVGETDESARKFEAMAMMQIYVVFLSIGISIFQRYFHYFQLFSLIIVADWAYTVFKVRGRKVRLNFVYWCILLAPCFFFQLKSIYLNNFEGSKTLKHYNMYYPYSNQFDKEIAPERRKVIHLSWRL